MKMLEINRQELEKAILKVVDVEKNMAALRIENGTSKEQALKTYDDSLDALEFLVLALQLNGHDIHNTIKTGRKEIENVHEKSIA